MFWFTSDLILKNISIMSKFGLYYMCLLCHMVFKEWFLMLYDIQKIHTHMQ